MREHASALALAIAAALVAALMWVFAPKPAPAVVLAPVRMGERGGLAVVDGVARIDLNGADEALLMELPGIGAALARAIVEGRPYGSAEELVRVKGIGEGKLAGLRERVTVSASE